MTAIILIVLLGILLMVTEVFLLPGTGLAGVGAFAACGYGVYRAFVLYGNTGGFITLAAVLVLSVVFLVLGLRSQTWKRFTLQENIDGTSGSTPGQTGEVHIGDTGRTLSRLAPSGKVMIRGKVYEAHTVDCYIDPQQVVEVTGFDDFSLVVRPRPAEHPLA